MNDFRMKVFFNNVDYKIMLEVL